MRGALAGLVARWGERLSSAKSAEQQALHNPLSAQEGVPLLPLPRPLFTSACSLHLHSHECPKACLLVRKGPLRSVTRE